MSDAEDIADAGPPAIDPYEELSVERDAPADKIKLAYRKSALRWHPGRFTHRNQIETGADTACS
jgi:curved DNA-binding protein CbpA